MKMDEQEKLARARQQVAALKGFYIHLAVFVLVMAVLFIINLATASSWWVQWPLLGWGIGVLAHGVAVSGRVSQAVTDWEARKTKQLIDRMG
jgi:hypothetical protein